jgi:membrane protein required for colicin V production
VSEFDLIVILLLAVSGLIGCLRGAAREVLTVIAFVVAVFAAIFSLKFTGPLFRPTIHPAWAANAVAALVVFVAVYLAARIAGARLTHNVRRIDSISLLDRVIGLGFGLIRGLVLLGVFQLLFSAAMPADARPGWIANAKLYPLAVDSGRLLRLLAPQGSAVANRLAPALQHAVVATPDSPPSDQSQEKSQ